MLSLDTINAMHSALDLPLEHSLHLVLSRRIEDTIACDLEDLTHIIVIQPGDTEADVVEAVGFSPFLDRIEKTPFDAEHQPDWDWAQYDNSHWQLIFCAGNEGWATILVVPDHEGIDPAFLSLCRTYACQPEQGAVG